MGKMVRLFTCLALTFFIFFASIPVSYASFEKNPLQFELTELKFSTRENGSHFAHGYLSWGNVSPYEILDLSGKLELHNKNGKKISIDSELLEIQSHIMYPGNNLLDGKNSIYFDLVPSVTKASDLTGAYLKPTYTFTLGSKAELSPGIYTETTSIEVTDTHYIENMIVMNRGEATAVNLTYSGLEILNYEETRLLYHENTHPVINESLRLEPGHFVRTSFKIPLDLLKSKFTNFDDLIVRIQTDFQSTTPYAEALNVTVNNQKLVNQTFTENDVTYVSLRELAKALGATIQWDDPTQTATLIQGDSTITIPVGSNRFLLNGSQATASAKAKLYNNTILVVPLRDISEMLNCSIYFDHIWGLKSVTVIPPLP
ncbi:copper amine oxidase N-terminal domain-containing protein [Brevibacillus porteri]|uniref:copper amine oxidase N-terminal domain-containing protein n=1 Tax=Brevibacillus porteri TaxID=2126350 RepID=UPI00370AEA43